MDREMGQDMDREMVLRGREEGEKRGFRMRCCPLILILMGGLSGWSMSMGLLLLVSDI
jgi:hypothetical protein